MLGDIVWYYPRGCGYVGTKRGTLIQFVDTEDGIRAIVKNESGRFIEVKLTDLSSNP